MSPLIEALLNSPECYDHQVKRLSLVETHISWVILTGKYAYKIKKPVNLGFLDFSTLEKRLEYCREELRLNRRLAAEYYLDVVSIAGSIAAPRINGDGAALEYAVKMREFPADSTLDLMAERGELKALHIDLLARRVARFHLHECAALPPGSPWGGVDAVMRPVRDNFAILKKLLDDATERQNLEELERWCEEEQGRLADLMSRRTVRECHGDLHLANVAWDDGKLVIFDCLEFDPWLRWIDPISEVAFCYMDLLHRKSAPMAWRFLNAWLSETGDYQGVALLSFYASYRAMVRAKVAGLRAQQERDKQDALRERSEFLKLAMRLSERRPAELWITHGLSGSGKTTLTQGLLEERGMIRLRSDVERKRIFGLSALEKSSSGIEAGLYSSEASAKTYARLHGLAEDLVREGYPVVIDAAFLERSQRDLFRSLAKSMGADFRILDAEAPPEVLRERIRARHQQGRDASEADLRVLEHQLATAMPLGQDELADTIRLEAGKT